VVQSSAIPPWDELVGQLIVLDMTSPWVFVGRLIASKGDFLVLEGADAHDLRDTSTTREKYILDCREHGVNENRRQVWVNLREVVGVSRLVDVLLP
jgi:hypothetical protein